MLIHGAQALERYIAESKPMAMDAKALVRAGFLPAQKCRKLRLERDI